jgi:hypothetical protein
LSLHPELDPTFTVTGTPAERPNKEPGDLSSFTIKPVGVDTTSSARRVHLSAQFKGPDPQRVSVYFYTEKRTKGIRPVYLRTELKQQGGEWSGTIRVPQWIGKQVLEPRIYASFGPNFRPSSRSYDTKDLLKLHASTRLVVVSGIDTTRPTLTSLSISPSPIDSTTGSVLVTVTATATDTGSGVEYIDVSGGIRHGINGVADGAYPLAASGIGYLSSDNFHVRLKRTANGDWVGTTKVRKCVPSGTYKLSASVRDKAGNYHFYDKKDLVKAGITSTVEVTSEHGDIANPYIYSAATLGAKNWLLLNFSEGVANVSNSTLTVYPLSPKSTRFTTPASVTDITCYNGDSDDPVDCSGSGGLVTAAVLTVPEIEAGKEYVIYANLNHVTTQLTDGNRNPMQWNYTQADALGSRSVSPGGR